MKLEGKNGELYVIYDRDGDDYAFLYDCKEKDVIVGSTDLEKRVPVGSIALRIGSFGNEAEIIHSEFGYGWIYKGNLRLLRKTI